MAKQGRPPKNASMDALDATLRGEIEEALKSQADESVASIYRRFGLSQRGILLRTFHNFATAVRQRLPQGRLSPAARAEDERVPEWDELDRWARREALARLQAGDAKVYELVLLSRSRRESDKLALEQQAEKRAEEKHAQWREKYLAAKAAADSKLDQMAVEKGIPEDVKTRIKDLYGINV